MGFISSRTYDIARNIHSSIVSDWSSEFMAGKTVFRNVSTGHCKLLKVDTVDTSLWKGVNYAKKIPRSIKKATYML